jgi:hypothetical protein
MDNPTTTEWAYLAGIIDGEGSLSIVQKRRQTRIGNGIRVLTEGFYENSFQCSITISNTDKRMIDWVLYTFGGCVYFSRRREGNRKTQFVVAWQSADSVRWIIQNTKPYLLTKYDVAEAMLKLLGTELWEKEVRAILFAEFKEIQNIRVKGDKP